MKDPRLIELTSIDSDGRTLGPIFVDALDVRSIGYGGGDCTARTLISGRYCHGFVAESPAAVMAMVDAVSDDTLKALADIVEWFYLQKPVEMNGQMWLVITPEAEAALDAARRKVRGESDG